MADTKNKQHNKHKSDVWVEGRKIERVLLALTVRCIWKHCSVFLRICWNVLRAVIPKQKDEICLDGMVLKVYGLDNQQGKFE